MLERAKPLLTQLKVNKEKMRENLDLTNGLILSQRLTFYLAEKIGKDTANDLMHDVAKYALENNLTLYEVSLENEIISKHISKSELKLILDPETYIGLAAEQAQIIIKEIELKRGRFGFYVTDGKINASLKSGEDMEITLEDAIDKINAKAKK